jgi:hypothetical protein
MQNYKKPVRPVILNPIVIDPSAWSYRSKKGEFLTAEIYRATIAFLIISSIYFFMLTSVFQF